MASLRELRSEISAEVTARVESSEAGEGSMWLKGERELGKVLPTFEKRTEKVAERFEGEEEEEEEAEKAEKEEVEGRR